MKKLSLMSCLSVFALLPLTLPAAVQFWDPDGVTPGTSVSGNWDTTTLNWTDTPDSGINAVWTQSNDASFVVDTDYTATLTAPITVGNFNLSGTGGTLTIAGDAVNSLTLAGPSTLDTGGRNVTISSPITGGFALNRISGGTLTLSGASTYSAGTVLNAGTTVIGVDSVSSGGVITSGPFGTGPVTFSTASQTINTSGGDRIVENPVTLNVNLSINGSSALTFTNGDWKIALGIRTVTVNNSADTILACKLTDDGTARTLVKSGSGRLIMSAGNSTNYLGVVRVTGGVLAAGNGTPFPTNNNNVINVNSGGTLDLNGFDVRLSRMGSDANNLTGSVLLGTNTLTAGNNASSSEFLGVISGSGGYVKVGSISQVLTGTNTFTGGITITDGSLYLPTNGVTGSPIALGAAANIITITGTGRIGQNKGAGTVSIVTNSVVLNTLTAGLDPASSSLFYLAGPVSGTGGFVRTTQGSGFPYLAGSNNTFTGGVKMDARFIGIGHKRALGTGPLTIGDPVTPPGSTLQLAASVDLVGADAVTNVTTVNQNFTFNGTETGFGLELSGPVTLASGTKTITATGTGLAKLSGVIGGSGGINKAGDNTLVLAGNNTYTGSTIVSAGTLVLTNSGSVAGSSDITVAAGATLDASGRTDGTLTVAAGKTLGGSGTILGSVTGGLTLSGGGTDLWQLSALSTITPGTDFDQLTLAGGNLVLGGTSQLSINFTGTATSPNDGDPFWSSPQSWTVLLLAGASNPGNSDFKTVINGIYTNGYFTTSVSGGNVLLNFTPGTPPQPQLTSVNGAGTTSVTINFTAAIKGATYQLQYKNDLSDVSWNDLGAVAGTGTTAAIIDNTSPAPTRRFYRVVVQ